MKKGPKISKGHTEVLGGAQLAHHLEGRLVVGSLQHLRLALHNDEELVPGLSLKRRG